MLCRLRLMRLSLVDRRGVVRVRQWLRDTSFNGDGKVVAMVPVVVPESLWVEVAASLGAGVLA